MRRLSDTISRLSTIRARQGAMRPGRGRDRLSRLDDFGHNPGDLAGRLYLPDNLPANAPLVVVLHGCTQNAADYDTGTGWSLLADRDRFALLFPEQQRVNNANLCFNWFEPGDMGRGAGEALSIRRMIDATITRHALDETRVFITGLSAGGAMANVMLATYPEAFSGGAIIAGLPYGCARSIPEAFDRMRAHGVPGEADLHAILRAASDHDGPWPRLSLWHGTSDTTVDPMNMEAIIGQWRQLHGIGPDPDRIEGVAGHQRRVWLDASGEEVIESYLVSGMGHGAPILRAAGADPAAAIPFMLEARISSTLQIARFWGIANGEALLDDAAPSMPAPSTVRPAFSVSAGGVIEDALRKAGLMR